MSAVMSHIARDEGVNLKLALLVVPSTDIRWAIGEPSDQSAIAQLYPSIALVEKNPWGPRSRMNWFMDYWIPDQPGFRKAVMGDWMASPMLAPNFQSLPRTHIVTAEFDLSRDESHQYGEKMLEHGNTVTMKCYAGVPHAFGHYNHPERGLRKSHEYVEDTCNIIRAAHSL
jgi:acetyl esterase/lipase